MKKFLFLLLLPFVGFGQFNPIFFASAQNTRAIVPFLDTYTGASVAYSLVKRNTSYLGNCIRVRRSSDNTEMDIGFSVINKLDESALLSFVGAGDGFVTVWYDQSGNARNATQTNTGYQPNIVLSGVVTKINGIASIKFGLSPLHHYFDVPVFSFTTASVFGVEHKVFDDVNSRLIACAATGTNDFDNNQKCFVFGGATMSSSFRGLSVSLSTLEDVTLLSTNILTTTNASMYRNSTTSSTDSSITSSICSPDIMQIGTEGKGTASLRFMRGYKHEFIFYATDQSANRTSIESAINQYYKIY